MFKSIRICFVGLVIIVTLSFGCKRTITRFALPTLEPQPDFIGQVRPDESSRVPLTVYKGRFTGIAGGLPDPEDGYASTVCLKLLPSSLIQKGDDFIDNEILDRIELIVDDTARSGALSLGSGSLIVSLDGTTQYPEGKAWFTIERLHLYN